MSTIPKTLCETDVSPHGGGAVHSIKSGHRWVALSAVQPPKRAGIARPVPFSDHLDLVAVAVRLVPRPLPAAVVRLAV